MKTQKTVTTLAERENSNYFHIACSTARKIEKENEDKIIKMHEIKGGGKAIVFLIRCQSLER